MAKSEGYAKEWLRTFRSLAEDMDRTTPRPAAMTRLWAMTDFIMDRREADLRKANADAPS